MIRQKFPSSVRHTKDDYFPGMGTASTPVLNAPIGTAAPGTGWNMPAAVFMVPLGSAGFIPPGSWGLGRAEVETDKISSARKRDAIDLNILFPTVEKLSKLSGKFGITA